ncbi:MAG: helix-turn-helix transcriptional regulator [Eubacteriales bacterium]
MIIIVPLYILGLLQRFGPQHGYQIKKIIAEQLADFTQIKLPTIYYHLEKMETEGLLSVSKGKSGSRPEKTIYSVTDRGLAEFRNKLVKLLVFDYRAVFPSDGVFYFSEYLETEEIVEHLKSYIQKMQETISLIHKHQKETMEYVPDDMKTMVGIVFSRHLHHYQAECDWAEETLKNLVKMGVYNGKAKDYRDKRRDTGSTHGRNI